MTPVENAEKKPAGTSEISFVIPLPAAPTVEYINEGEAGKEHATECPGTVAEPKASEGFLCIYTELAGFGTFEEAPAYTAGAVLKISATLPGFPTYGTWAVTAEEEK